MLFRPHQVEIRDTGTPRGFGVFAVSPFLKGGVVELCPVVVFRAPYDSVPESLQHRIFNWTALTKSNEADLQAVALGYGAMYNSANPANMRYEPDETGKFLRFIAVRNISPREELTINYSGDGGPEWEDENWFDSKGITPI